MQRDGAALTGEVVDLTGRALGSFAGTADLRPWEIVTLRLRRRA